MSYLAKIRNRDGVIADFIYRSYKAAQRFNVGPIPGLYHLLAGEREFRRNGLVWLKRKFYDEPLFRLKCTSCGPGLQLEDGIPLVYGDLDFRVGANVTMHGTSTIAGAKVFNRPRFTIGDRTHCGSQFSVSVGAGVSIGNDVMIANRVHIVAYDSHPLDMTARIRHEPAAASTSKPIRIDDGAWIGMGVFIMKGVTIGRGAVVAAGSVVTKDVPAFCIAAGNPARVVKRLDGAEPAQQRREAMTAMEQV